MNVLILTPDAVGSTLLQRMLTIYMQFHEFDRPVINLHELTNGLTRYYSPEFNRELVSKKEVKNWGYYQTLQEVSELLDSVDHYKTSRLAHYHIRQRGDTVSQQIPFYKYLNDNFYVIACRRANVFEHALSMTLNKITKKLNVYDAYEKIDTFYEIYQSGVALDEQVFVNQLNAYRAYVDWSEQHFNISSFFNYEKDVPRLEEYILDLPVFSSQTAKITWQKNFGLTFNEWNKMHYVRSDLNNLLEISPKLDQLGTEPKLKKLLEERFNIVSIYQRDAPSYWPAVTSKEDIEHLPAQFKDQLTPLIINQQGLIPFLSEEKQKKIIQYQDRYANAQKTINQMTALGILISGPPIKKQTLGEKKKIIKNFDRLIEVYNNWSVQNSDICGPINSELVASQAEKEFNFWNNVASTALITGK
jgi:hypothetical protein